MFGNAGLPAHVSERPVAIVVKQPAWPWPENARDTVMMRSIAIDAAAEGLVELGKLANEQIEPAVVVVVEPHRAGIPAGSRHPRFLRHVRECPIAVIVIENAALVLRNVEVGKAVAVVVARRHPHAVAAAGHTGLFGHVGERAVMIVAIQSVPQGVRRIVKIAFPAVDQINIHPAVIVVIEKRTAGSARFRQVLFRRLARRVYPPDTAARRWDLFESVRESGRRTFQQRDFYKWPATGKEREILQEATSREQHCVSERASVTHPPHYA